MLMTEDGTGVVRSRSSSVALAGPSSRRLRHEAFRRRCRPRDECPAMGMRETGVPETIGRVIDRFFTTKPRDRGPGLACRSARTSFAIAVDG
jgi:hypothetical protein